jgi:hypothetical protein
LAPLSGRSNLIWPVGPFEKYFPPQKIAYLKDAAHHIVGGDGHDVAVIIAAGHLEINDCQLLASAIANTSVADPDPNPRVFGPPGSGSGSTSQRYGSGSGSFYHQGKIVRKTLIPPIL